tara:strand:+ start:176 stop:526 length:351 start_codon:yes stop_codon:yes gene_type:complete
LKYVKINNTNINKIISKICCILYFNNNNVIIYIVTVTRLPNNACVVNGLIKFLSFLHVKYKIIIYTSGADTIKELIFKYCGCVLNILIKYVNIPNKVAPISALNNISLSIIYIYLI